MKPISGAERAAVQSVPFRTRIIKLVGKPQLDAAFALLRNLPLGADLEVVIRKAVKGRTLDQNAAMWAGPLRDISEQAWIEGRQFSIEVWHDHFKREYLPDEFAISREELEHAVKHPDTYRKWDIGPGGDRVLVGSTTELTKSGFTDYLRQVEAFGAELGVQFSANPRGFEGQMA